MFTEIEVPPDYEVWADQSYHKIQAHLKDKHIPYFEDLLLDWIAAPYFSLWKGKNKDGNIWVLHNDLATDGFVDQAIGSARQALAYFSYRWQHGSALKLDRELTADPNITKENLFGNMLPLGNILQDVVEDEKIWQ